MGKIQVLEDWVRTDDDPFQLRRKIMRDGCVEYELYQVQPIPRRADHNDNTFAIAHGYIDPDEIDIDACLQAYSYESIEEVKDDYGDDWQGVLAECEFETYALSDYLMEGRRYLTAEEAEDVIRNLSGFEVPPAPWVPADDSNLILFRRVCPAIYDVCAVRPSCSKRPLPDGGQAYIAVTATINVNQIGPCRLATYLVEDGCPDLNAYKEKHGKNWGLELAKKEFNFTEPWHALYQMTGVPLAKAKAAVRNHTGYKI